MPFESTLFNNLGSNILYRIGDLYLILRKGGIYVGIIGKFSLDRLKDPKMDLRFKCPYCKSAEIHLKNEEELNMWGGTECPKCESQIVLDSLSITVIREKKR